MVHTKKGKNFLTFSVWEGNFAMNEKFNFAVTKLKAERARVNISRQKQKGGKKQETWDTCVI